ncbi:MAG: hypothetical protein ACD_73C00143G0004 [uncultured bacterium]|nr:MAG: hypothetical protein ACD_73C00143G0004 [uncultured bacterium]
MRLKKEQIQKLSERILRALKEKDQLIFRVPENKVLDKINDVITADMRAEDDLEGEARRILDKYKASGTDIDERQMLLMIKKQLVKEKKLVL